MSSTMQVNAAHYRQYLQAATQEEIEKIIGFLPSQKLQKDLKRSFIGLNQGNRVKQTDATKIESQLKNFEANEKFSSLRKELVQRRSEQVSGERKEVQEAIKQGATSVTYTLANLNGESDEFIFNLEDIPRDEALNIIKISPLNARTDEILPAHVVTDIMETLPNGQKEAAFGYRVGDTIYLFDGLRRFSAYNHIETDRPFRIYVTDKEFSIFHYQSYDLMDLAKLGRTPLQSLKHWLKLAEEAGLKLGKKFSTAEQTPKEEVEAFFKSVGVSYNTYRVYSKFESLHPALVGRAPDEHRLSKTDLTALVRQQSEIEKSGKVIEEVVANFPCNENANNKDFINGFKTYVTEKVLNAEAEPLTTSRILFNQSSKTVKLTEKAHSKYSDLTLTAKRLSKKNKADLEALIQKFVNEL
ncbi:ParB N-terminal domain-containing protein [Vibrio penaeicida]|uniref:hypothetical protein n=1 Tax=Vibrio penaeicida TaxID=104609 RepID=UPI001CC41D53|nr:hypothetical protein [Vibrio penaeicida]